jgi:DNA-binding NarL/FixJ family response regulator
VIVTWSEKSQSVPVVLVSRPGFAQQALRSSLTACCGIVVVASTGDGLTALSQVRHLRPELLVIDSNLLDEEVTALIAAVKTEQPAMRCLVFLRSSRQEAQMLALGADAVALRDAPAQDLQAVLSRLAQAG